MLRQESAPLQITSCKPTEVEQHKEHPASQNAPAHLPKWLGTVQYLLTYQPYKAHNNLLLDAARV